MTPSLLAAALFLCVAVVGRSLLSRVARPIRLLFDASAFLGISLYLYFTGVLPLFSPIEASIGAKELELRIIVGAWWLFGAQIVVVSLRQLFRGQERSREARLFTDLAAGAIYLVVGAIVLNSVFALPVNGVVATSGVVAIVLGLALQSTLADVFAGIAVGVEAPFGIGDLVKIGERIEGQIVQINWRSIRVQTDEDDIAIIPNSLVAKAEIINRSFPTSLRTGSVDLSVPNSGAPERVVEILLHATMLCPHISPSPRPRVTLVHLGRKRNKFKISFVVEHAGVLGETKDAVLRAVRRQLRYADFFAREPQNSPELAEEPAALSPGFRLTRDLILFESLSEEQVRRIVSELLLLHLEPGDTLFAEGADDQTLYLIASGVLDVSRKIADKDVTIGAIGGGEYIGEIGLLTGAAHAATVIARTHCAVYLLSREAVAPLLSENHKLASAFEKSVRRGLDLLDRQVAVSVTPGLGERGQLLAKIQHFFRLRIA